jgi:hypothetical protein
LLNLRGNDGTRYQISYLREREFELGQLFIGPETVTWLMEKPHADLFQNGLDAISRLRFADERMAAQLQPGLPEIAARFETADRLALVMRKAPDLLLLSDVLAHFNGRMDARHVAWIVSSLLNLACYLDYAEASPTTRFSTDAVLHLAASGTAAPCSAAGGTRSGRENRCAPRRPLTVQYAPYRRHDLHRRGDHPHRPGTGCGRWAGNCWAMSAGRGWRGIKAAPPAMLDWLRACRPAVAPLRGVPDLASARC